MTIAPKKIMGLDLSLTSPGMAVLQANGTKIQLLDYLNIKTSANEHWFTRRQKISLTIQDFVTKHHPEVIFIENYSYGSRNGRELAGEVHGIVIYDLINKGFSQDNIYRVISPTQLKKFIVRKGNATKEQVVESINTLFDLELKKNQDDIADAIGIAFIGYCMFYFQEVEQFLDKQQLEVMNKILKSVEENRL